MKIIVCIKQVPDTTDIKIDPKTGTMKREGVPAIINPDDKQAIQTAVKLKGKNKITVITMGPPQAEDALREALALGADDAILFTDRAFAGSDTWATANVLSTCLRKVGKYDLILCGRQAIDGDTAQVGPQLAENLGIPQVTYVQKVEVDDGKVKAERETEDGIEVVEVEMPALLTVMDISDENTYPSLQGIHEAYNKKEVKVMTNDDIKADEKKIGLLSSPTIVKKVFAPEAKGQGKILEGSVQKIAGEVIGMLKEKEIIKD